MYWANLPGGFAYSGQIDPSGRAGPHDAVYLSLVTLATLGFGDIVPVSSAMRIVAPLQAVVGFALLTAAVSRVLQIYPALTRRRALAVRLSLLQETRVVEALPVLSAATSGQLMESLAGDVVRVRLDLAQYAITYYFRDTEEPNSLAAMLPHALELAAAGRRVSCPDVRLAAEMLGHAVDGLARVLDRQFLRHGGATAEILVAYAADHARLRT